MDKTTEAGELFGNDPRYKGNTFLLDLTIVNPRVSSNLEVAVRYTGKHLSGVVEQKKNKNGGSFPVAYSLHHLHHLVMSTRGELGPDVYSLMK